MFRKGTLVVLTVLFQFTAIAQAPPAYTSGDIYLQLNKLKVLGSVLYFAAHPDDENTRLLAYLSKERLYRTGYLSLTRGDGGQNLIGDEQGIDLGLIRTQELLAARRIDGAEQFFSTAYDFGFSKTTEEALKIWDREKVLSDAVWIIRKFQPDVIVTRFPPDSRAGHGHHSGSAVIAAEAFRAAGDPGKFPEQFKFGVKPWKVKRIVWNSFMGAGDDNKTVKLDVGAYNPILGKSYGEIAAHSRSQHKSQGFGVPGTRGVQIENFNHTDGEPAKSDIFDNIDVSWKRVKGGEQVSAAIDDIIKNFSLSQPALSVPSLVQLYKQLQALDDNYWRSQKSSEVLTLIEACSGIWMEAVTTTPFAVQGDSIRVQVALNNRSGAKANVSTVKLDSVLVEFNKALETNVNLTVSKAVPILATRPLSQPYWLEQKMNEGTFNVKDQTKIGVPENPSSLQALFNITIEGTNFTFVKPVRYRYTDPVKGEIYQPVNIVPAATVSTEPSVFVFKKTEKKPSDFQVRINANRNFMGYEASVSKRMKYDNTVQKDADFNLLRGLWKEYNFKVDNTMLNSLEQDNVQVFTELKKGNEVFNPYLSLTGIHYDHIPDIYYYYQDNAKALNIDLKIAGKRIGYIEGAGDKVPVALTQMGYEVVTLKERDLTFSILKQFDAIITGVRAYNVHGYLNDRHNELMDYVREGGNLIVQYNTNSFAGPIAAKIGPYPFTVSRNRVTDQTAKVTFAIPDHAVLNYPNKITSKDFEGWIQERGIYFADQIDPHYQAPLTMADPGEDPQKGSLIITDYGKGKFVYTGLVFFRELPAGVPGAYRLLANIIALSKKQAF